MKCGFCGHDYDDELAEKGCGSCHGGCHSSHCPRCSYKNPLEPAMVTSLKKLFHTKGTHKGEQQ